MSDRTPDPLIEEALHWLVVLRDESATAEDRRAFDRWRAADLAHETAWRRAQTVWARADILAPALGASTKALPPLPAPRAPSRRRLLAAAACAVVVPAGLLFARPGLLTDLVADLRTAPGERRKVILDDNSTVELAGASALSVSFGPETRRVRLMSGEAFFTVVPDATRPFIVEAGSGRTQALGTAFDVKLEQDAVSVAVTKHKVSVSVDGNAATIVEQGQRVRYTAKQIYPAQEADLNQVEAWRRDRLVFQDAPLGEVIADLERYRGGCILLTDAHLRDMRVTAVFDTRKVDDALVTIASALPIHMRRLTDFLVVLSPSD